MAVKKGLLDLPPEIWSKIGKMVIDDRPIIKDWILAYSMSMRGKGTQHQPHITCTCRVLREELLPYFYQKRVELHLSHREISWNKDAVMDTGKCLRTVGLLNRQHIRMAWVWGAKGSKGFHEVELRDAWGVAVELVPDDCTHSGETVLQRYQIKFL